LQYLLLAIYCCIAFLGVAYERIYDSLCLNLVPFIAAITLMIVIISLLSAIAVVSVTCVNRKWYPVQVQATPGQHHNPNPTEMPSGYTNQAFYPLAQLKYKA
jgi:hypothetical protein